MEKQLQFLRAIMSRLSAIAVLSGEAFGWLPSPLIPCLGRSAWLDILTLVPNPQGTAQNMFWREH